MARTIAELPKGSRITDFISVGVNQQDLSVGEGEQNTAQHRENKPEAA